MDNRKKILIVDNSIALTGALKAIVSATAHLTSEFDFVYILPTGSSAVSFLQGLNLSYDTLPFVEISKRPLSLIKYLPFLLINGLRLKKLAATHNAHIIHLNDFYNLTGIMAIMAGADIKLVTHVRFLPQKFSPIIAKFWANLNLKYANHIICVSEAVRAFFPTTEKVLVIPDPIPENEKHAPKLISAKNPDEIHLLYLSNFIMGKGQNFALEAFKIAYQQDHRLRLAFVGGDMGLAKNRFFREELIREVANAGLQKIVGFESFVEDVEARIKAADILLNFSESESFSLTCLDALFFGTPLIASDCGGPAELFQNNISGYLVPNKNVGAMAQAIMALAQDVDKRISFAQAGKVYVRQKFGSEKSYLQLKALYKNLIK